MAEKELVKFECPAGHTIPKWIERDYIMAGVKDSSLTNKATSPSQNIQRAVDQSWGAQNTGGNGTSDPKTLLNNKWNEKPVKP